MVSATVDPAAFAAEVTQRLAAQAAATRTRRDTRRQEQADHTRRRTAGLRKRHARKHQQLQQREKTTMPRTPARVTFGQWLKDQAHRKDPVGKLARQYTAPCSCTACVGRTSRRYSPAGVREELRRHNAKPATLAALDTAETEWRQQKQAQA